MMNLLFLALGKYSSIKNRGIYLDLLRVFIKNGYEVFVVTSLDPESRESFQRIDEEHSHILKVKTGRITKTNPIEKGWNMILLERRYIRAIEKHFPGVRFDLVLYPTPPITFLNVVKYIKKRDGAETYLMLKDIFPQNAADIGMMKKSGMSGAIYRYFRNREKQLYKVSDHIGCMSEANIDYLLKHNPEVDPARVGICPNALEITDRSCDAKTRTEIRKKYGIPLDQKVFVYGGNLGKPQDIPFVIECLKAVRDLDGAFFLIVGDGTEYKKLEAYADSSAQKNFRLMKRLPKDDYDNMIGACDIGLIFLDHRFTIPNFPSRLLSYMAAKLPVLAATDRNTDLGKVITEGGFGFWCESNSAEAFRRLAEEILSANTEGMKEREFAYLAEHFSSEKAYEAIQTSIGKEPARHE